MGNYTIKGQRCANFNAYGEVGGSNTLPNAQDGDRDGSSIPARGIPITSLKLEASYLKQHGIRFTGAGAGRLRENPKRRFRWCYVLPIFLTQAMSHL